MDEVIWFKDIHAFIDPNHLGRFFPVQHMTLTEQLNATVRFAIYFSIILLIAGRSSYVLFIPIAAAGATYLMHISTLDVNSTRAATTKIKEENATQEDLVNSSTIIPCRKPSKDNPFMNVLQSDYSTSPNRGEACDIQDPAIASKAEKLFDQAGSGLVRDVDDVFNRRASSRQFVTNPSTTIPNDQTAFASWLYGSAPTCKPSDRSACQYRT